MWASKGFVQGAEGRHVYGPPRRRRRVTHEPGISTAIRRERSSPGGDKEYL
jgi:hypothetical protein